MRGRNDAAYALIVAEPSPFHQTIGEVLVVAPTSVLQLKGLDVRIYRKQPTNTSSVVRANRIRCQRRTAPAVSQTFDPPPRANASHLHESARDAILG